MSEDKYGVLLYYKYAEIPNLDDLLTFYHSNCSSLSLLGRVRLSSHDVNVTVSVPFISSFILFIPNSLLFTQVGGNLSSLKNHIEALKAYRTLFHHTDFKLDTCHHPLNNKVA